MIRHASQHIKVRNMIQITLSGKRCRCTTDCYGTIIAKIGILAETGLIPRVTQTVALSAGQVQAFSVDGIFMWVYTGRHEGSNHLMDAALQCHRSTASTVCSAAHSSELLANNQG